jgi:muconolactone delta-isomerase
MELLVSLEIEPPAGRPADAIEDRSVLESLPLYDWFTVRVTPLSPHPNDPALVDS